MTGIRLLSMSFSHSGLIPDRYSKDGGNISPAQEWSGVPPWAVELLLLCEDPDAAGGPVLHWLVTKIDPACTKIAAGSGLPEGKVWLNDFGELGYGGPRPPIGAPPHRYFFRLFALAEPVRLCRHPSVADVHRAIRGAKHTSGTVVGHYQRQLNRPVVGPRSAAAPLSQRIPT